MATFNADGRSVDHAVSALAAAISLRDKAALADLQLGLGIAVGAAVVGSLASGANVSVVGAATNLAARLQAAAGPGEVLIDGEAYRRVRDWLGERGIAAVPRSLDLKGFDGPVSAYVLAGAAAPDGG
jgi:adenylate cyclase